MGKRLRIISFPEEGQLKAYRLLAGSLGLPRENQLDLDDSIAYLSVTFDRDDPVVRTLRAALQARGFDWDEREVDG